MTRTTIRPVCEHASIVPTWNYVVAHVYGRFRLDDSQSRRLDIIRRYMDFYESGMDQPWSLSHNDDDFIDRLLDAIVGFRIDIERIEGKRKLSQNHEPMRQEKVVRALREAGGEDRQRIADLMSDNIRGKEATNPRREFVGVAAFHWLPA